LSSRIVRCERTNFGDTIDGQAASPLRVGFGFIPYGVTVTGLRATSTYPSSRR
jgi:hypothetical protein